MAGRVLFISENAPVPSDRRVWNEARTLHAAGWEVVVACAQGDGRHDAPYELIEGIEIHRFPLAPATGGLLGYAREYGQAMWRINRLARKLGRERGFDVVHACNPPDFLLLAALGLAASGGRAVRVRPARPRARAVPLPVRRRQDLLYRAVCALERLTYRLADVVHLHERELPAASRCERGGRRPGATSSWSATARPRALPPCRPTRPGGGSRTCSPTSASWGRRTGSTTRSGARPSCATERRRLARRVHRRGRRASRDAWRSPSGSGSPSTVEFAGWRSDDDIRAILSTADVCLAPDPPSPLNDVSTMIKIPEYMAMGRPIVSYDLTESRVSAGDAALYATPGDVDGVRPGRIAELLEDPELRAQMGAIGRERVGARARPGSTRSRSLAAYARAARDAPAGRGEARRARGMKHTGDGMTPTTQDRLRTLVVIQGGAGAKVTGPEIRGWAVAHALAERHEVTVALHDPPAASRDGIRLVPFSRSTLISEARTARRRRRPDHPAVPVRRPAWQRDGDGVRPVRPDLARAVHLLGPPRHRPRDPRAEDDPRRPGALRRRDRRGRRRPARPTGRRARPALGRAHGAPGRGHGALRAPGGTWSRIETRPLREAFPQIGPDDPVVLWWGKVGSGSTRPPPSRRSPAWWSSAPTPAW